MLEVIFRIARGSAQYVGIFLTTVDDVVVPLPLKNTTLVMYSR